MASYYAKVTFTGAGGPQNLTVPFDFIDKTHVLVYYNGVLKSVGTDYTWAAGGVINTSNAPLGSIITIKRRTPVLTRVVDYQDGTTLTEAALDADSRQPIFLVQEFLDDFTDGVILGVNLPQLGAIRFFGGMASDPTVRPDGSALGAGDAYFNTVTNELRVWTGTMWVSVSTTAVGAIRVPDFLLQNTGIY